MKGDTVGGEGGVCVCVCVCGWLEEDGEHEVRTLWTSCEADISTLLFYIFFQTWRDYLWFFDSVLDVKAFQMKKLWEKEKEREREKKSLEMGKYEI